MRTGSHEYANELGRRRRRTKASTKSRQSGAETKTEAIKIIYHQGQSSEHINEYVDLSASLLGFFTL